MLLKKRLDTKAVRETGSTRRCTHARRRRPAGYSAGLPFVHLVGEPRHHPDPHTIINSGGAASAARMPTGKPYQVNQLDRGTLELLLERKLSLKQIAQTIRVSIPTLRKTLSRSHRGYRFAAWSQDVRTHRQQRELVTKLASVAQSHDVIAKCIGLSKASVQTHFKDELELGALGRQHEGRQKPLRWLATGPIESKNHGHRGDLVDEGRMGWRGRGAREDQQGRQCNNQATSPAWSSSCRTTGVASADHATGQDRQILGREDWWSNPNEGDVLPDEGDPEPDANG